MSDSSAATLSRELADAVDAAGPSVVQVQGRRWPVSGVAFAPDAVVTTARGLDRQGAAQVRTPDGRTIDAEVAGWDVATNLVALRVPGANLTPARAAADSVRVGSLALALARSMSNVVTASFGVVSIVGGPLRTGRGRGIEQVIRTTAPMHEGFAGGAFIDVAGHLVGITTGGEIRGLAVVIPAAIALSTAQTLLTRGSTKRAYLGLAGQAVALGEAQAATAGRERALLVVQTSAGSPAAAAGVLVGDVVLAVDGQPIDSAETLLEHLWTVEAGRAVVLRVLRGSEARDVTVTTAERPRPS
jgi:S1-C subfamily serine protease